MSIKVMSKVWDYSQQKGSNLLILLAIADFANDAGYAYPSVRTLSEKSRMSESNTHYVLRKLLESGELTVQRNAGPNRSNLWRVLTLEGATGNRERVQPVIVEGATHCTQTVIEPSEEPIPLLSANATSNGIEYPHKAIMARYHETLGYSIPNGAQEGKAVKALLKAGHTEDDIFECYQHLKTQHFWMDKHLSLQKVRSEIGAWKKWVEDGKPTTQTNGNYPPRPGRAKIEHNNGQEFKFSDA